MARERDRAESGEPAGRIIRRTAAKTKAFSTAIKAHPVRAVALPEGDPAPDRARRSRCPLVSAENLVDIFFPADGFSLTRFLLSPAVREATAVDGHRVAVMPHAAQQRVHHRFVAGVLCHSS